MRKPRKTLERILSGSRNVRFADMQALVEAFGFTLIRISGSHHIFTHPDLPELINLQEVGGHAKPYQVRQFLKLVEQHSLGLENNQL